ncbi:MAG: hypothetical protein UR89_C0004G0011 [Candidatus Roizmanbacteria bacterium GW2011_GWA2_35_8]|uniref:Uncharacterized protein n=1 Tax=Candidatus Roizmanbacteria bacterium GW2011_GWA2_35_8 TaxID=1618479 RepID=A0A0G0G680_9BACT|nr:MAG: hypothetical protein UR89_C0004G0011 [Candidatus Roizmanbacteria bacterium GW2011_GWA2_35_8]
MKTEDKVKNLMDKIKKFEKGESLDLSSNEDLSIAIMNLISIEEHLFFTAEKTGKNTYFDLLQEVREMRKELLKLIIKDYEGEVWCISKHLLASSMRVMEVATKALNQGDKIKAYDLFKKSYDLYNTFWGLNLGSIDKKVLENLDIKEKVEELPIPVNHVAPPVEVKPEEKTGFFARLGKALSSVIDFNCCNE